MLDNFFEVDNEIDEKINKYLSSLDKRKPVQLIEKFYYDETLMENKKLKEIILKLNNSNDETLENLKKESLKLIEVVNKMLKK